MSSSRPPAKKRKPSSAASEALRAEVIYALEDLLEVSAVARHNLKSTENILKKVVRMLEDGRPGREIVNLAHTAVLRAEISTMLHRVRAARHHAQQAQFKMAIAEGYTMAEIARTWGVSRQLVSRMLKEPAAPRRS